MITPARKLKPIETHPLRKWRKVFQWEVRPLSGKEGYWSGHRLAL
jgi:hypothetical protein